MKETGKKKQIYWVVCLKFVLVLKIHEVIISLPSDDILLNDKECCFERCIMVFKI